MKKKKNKQSRPPSKFDNWIERKSAGREKQYIVYMLIFSFLLMGTVIAMRYMEDEPKPANYDLNIKPKPIELNEEANTDLIQQYDKERDEEMVELLEEYQMLIDQVPMDTLRIHEVQNEIRTLKEYYEKN